MRNVVVHYQQSVKKSVGLVLKKFDSQSSSQFNSRSGYRFDFRTVNASLIVFLGKTQQGLKEVIGNN